ncbi:hypothetical protein, partial [Rufibacter ruber]|uniref:hypothetical protein n=1 Tax=Rufibacter ruber TaxID=1783499 RepID=UPI0019D3B8D5
SACFNRKQAKTETGCYMKATPVLPLSPCSSAVLEACACAEVAKGLGFLQTETFLKINQTQSLVINQ